jgi:hypothetical protein
MPWRVSSFASAFLVSVLVCFGVCIAPSQAHAALIGHWTLDAGDIDWDTGTVTDVSGNGNNGTVHNLNASDEAAGQVDGGLTFNGTNSYISVPVNGSFPVSGNNPRTVCMWFKPAADSWTPDVNSIFEYGDYGESFGIDMDSFPDIQFYTWHNDMMVAMGIAGHQDDWLQICWVWDGVSSSLLYSNGALRGSQDFGSSINTPQTEVSIGRSFLTGGYFPGTIDDVRMYDSAFTDTQIESLYTEATNPVAISNLASTTGETTATVTWDTGISSDSTVWYGTSSSGYTESTSSATLVTSHSIGLTGLTPRTAYYYVVVSNDGSGNIATSSEEILTTVDLTPPVISNAAASATDTGAGITWNTDEEASTKVAYSIDTTYASSTDETDTLTGVTNHSADLSLLDSCTTYHYEVVSADSSGNIATSSPSTFTTIGCPAAPIEEHRHRSGGGSVTEQVANLIATGNTAAANAVKALWPALFPPVAAGSASGMSVRDLELGMTGNDVLALQKLLNANGSVLAAAGAGSPGNETDYFGSLTQAALATYQAAHRIAPAAGYFGSITRAQMKTAGLSGLWW